MSLTPSMLAVGDKLIHQGLFTEAAVIFAEMVDKQPHNTIAWERLGFCRHQQREFTEAAFCYNQAVILGGGLPAVTGLADAYAFQFQTERALDVLKKIDINKLSPEQQAFVHLSKANIYALDYQLETALIHYHQAEHHMANFYPLWVSMGHCYMELINLDDAGFCYKRAYELKPDSLETTTALAHYNMTTGYWKRGWELQEWRVNEPKLQHHPDKERYGASIPRWTGEHTGVLAVLHEGGLGDLTHFMRYITEASRRCDKLLFVVPPKYFDWVDIFDWPDNVKIMGTLQKGTYDAHAALMSMPYMLKLYTPEESPSYPRCRIGNTKVKPKQVSLTWFGSSKHPNDVARSMKLSDWMPLIESRPDINWVTPSPEDRALQESMDTPVTPTRPTDALDAAMTLAESAAVICVDSAHAHIAGSLGRPVLMACTHLPEWRWGWKDATPWYPSMTIVRQKKPRDWGHVVPRVKNLLDKLIPPG